MVEHEGLPMPRRLLLLPVALFLSTPALADADYLTRFDGRFSGSGTVQRDVDPQPRRVSCRIDGRQSGPDALSLSGSCRAAVIFTREIGADIRYDPGSDRFTGIYRGSTTGPAQLSGGRLRGDTLTMALTYAQPIYGDRDAVMTIVNAGNGRFTMTVSDEVDGRTVQTSNVSLQGN